MVRILLECFLGLVVLWKNIFIICKQWTVFSDTSRHIQSLSSLNLSSVKMIKLGSGKCLDSNPQKTKKVTILPSKESTASNYWNKTEISTKEPFSKKII